MAKVDLAALRPWIGRSVSHDDPLPPERSAALAATLDWGEPRPEPGDALAPGGHWVYFWDDTPTARLGSDGHPRRGDFLPPVSLPRRMWAGGRLAFEQPLRLGRPAHRRSTIDDITLKEGRSGQLVFVTVRHEIFQADRLALIEEQTIVYRDLPSAAATAPPPRKPAPDRASWSRTVRADPVLLFRYSALTFNAHRIHYDRDHCRREGYPGLLVHGPLLATWLLDLARRHVDDARFRQFSFRALGPLFDGAPITLAGRRQGARADLWAAGPDGLAAMHAEVLFDAA